jgi:hypothetical protein
MTCNIFPSLMSYLNEPGAHSQFRGHFYLRNKLNAQDIHNGAIHNNTSISNIVVSSPAEAEMGSLFYNAKDGTGFRTTLEEMGHTQEATPMQTDSTTALGIANGTIKQ